MRCKNCDYALWNITARKCPECGTDFKPSEFQFVPNAVRYLCPHCEQDYYGTGMHGHLVPRTFQCVRCERRIDMDEMQLLPTAGVDESQTSADIMPWLQRKQMGWIKGWMRTVGMSMVAPQKLIRAVPREGSGGKGGLGEAALFAFITNTIIAALGVSLPLAAFAMIATMNSGRDAMEMLFASGVMLLVGGIDTLIMATLWALVAHGLLRVSGPTADGLGGTMQAMFYSSGANVPQAVPCIGPYCGGYFVWIWWVVSAILMVIERQKVGGLRASLCVLTGPLLAIGAMVAWFVWLMFAVSQQVAAMGGGVGTSYTPIMEARTMHSAVIAYAQNNNGGGPGHALQLVADGSLPAANFALWQISHDEANVSLPAAGMTLDQYAFLPPNRMAMAAQAEADLLPANVIAHRLGDVVFTYHGIADLRNAPAGVWIAIVDPDPEQATTAFGTGVGGVPTGRNAAAVDGAGNIVPVTAATRAMLLQQQNALRAMNNLPPLPDPATILNGVPATGP